MNYIKVKYKILFIVVFLIAVITRVILWPTLLEANIDEAMTAINASSITDTGKDMYGVSFPVYLETWKYGGQSVMLAYLTAFCIKLFGMSMFSVRLPMLLVSLISIIVFYDFTKRIFKDKKIALLAMFLLSITPWHILQSKWSIDCNMFPHFALFSMYFLYRGITEKKLYLYISMIFFGLSMYTYGVSIYFVPLFLLISAIYLLINKKINIKELIICILIYMLIFTPLFIMYLINFLKIDKQINLGIFTITYFSEQTRTNDMLLFSSNILNQLLKNITSLLSVIFLQYDNLPWNATSIFGTTYHISIIFIIISLINYFRKKENNIGIKLFVLWFILSLFVGIFINETNINRLNIIWYPLIFFTLYGLLICFKNKQTLIIILYAILFISYNIFFYTSYYKEINRSVCFGNGLKEGYEFLSNYNNSKYYLNFDNTIQFKTYIKFYNEIFNQNVLEQTSIEELDKDSIYIIKSSDIDKINVSGFTKIIYGEYIYGEYIILKSH